MARPVAAWLGLLSATQQHPVSIQATVQTSLHDSIDELPAAAWNALAGPADPFLSHEFLGALEHSGAIGAGTGWHPRHVAVHRGEDLVGGMPCYLKDHSFGEFVFDWSWAHAYARYGRKYYPKLVTAIPYVPVTGRRLLVKEQGADREVSAALAQCVVAGCARSGASSAHVLFTDQADSAFLRDAGWLLRSGYQYHWRNEGYRDFQDFLDSFVARYRKMVRQERRRVAAYGLRIEMLSGGKVTADQWWAFYRCYLATFDKKLNHAPLSAEFFMEIGRRMPERVLLCLVSDRGCYVAGAIFFVGEHALYGRHWGSLQDYPDLHFEVCYYTPIEYCIEHAIRRFEAGAQGEFKVRRGFRPVATHSAHWIAAEDFRLAIDGFVMREGSEVAAYLEEMQGHLPFRAARLTETGR